MSYNLRLEIPATNALFQSIKPEFDSKGDRSSIMLDYKEGILKAKIEAKDPVALQATFNSLIKLVRVHEKVNEI